MRAFATTRRTLLRIVAALCWLVTWAGLARAETTVVWVSLDGMRSDYLDRTDLPFFKRLMTEGAYSRKFYPVFPSLTFPSHCSQATGVEVARHGVTGNGFYDSTTKVSVKFPADASLLQAEPIWLTAARQGVRTLVYDWPLSQNQRGPVRTEYFADKFDGTLTDPQRLDRLLDTWKADKGNSPLRLLMCYVEGTDPDGHRYGPDAPEIVESLQNLDRALGVFFDRAVAQWKATAKESDQLYVLVTTDHGMSAVKRSVSLEKVLGLTHGQTEITLQTTGNVGSVFLDKIPAGAGRDSRVNELIDKFHEYPFIRAYKREELPAVWGYAHPTRTGDIVAVLPQGYTFTSGPQAVTEGGGPKGMHGYPSEDDPEMYGVAFVWRSGPPLGGKDLGDVYWDQYHPTVAKWLGIKPADGLKGKLIVLPGD